MQTNPKPKQAIRLKIEEYMSFAELIKKQIQQEDHDNNVASHKQSSSDLNFSSASRTFTVEQVKYEDVIGFQSQKEYLKERIILPLKFPHLFNGARLQHRALLLYGVRLFHFFFFLQLFFYISLLVVESITW